MDTVIIIALVLAGLWIVALEVRFHSLKNIAKESRELADEAANDAAHALQTVTSTVKGALGKKK